MLKMSKDHQSARLQWSLPLSGVSLGGHGSLLDLFNSCFIFSITSLSSAGAPIDVFLEVSTVTSTRKSEVMEKMRQELKKPRRLPWPPKPTPLKGNDHHSPALRWSLLILNMELRKNSLVVGESIY